MLGCQFLTVWKATGTVWPWSGVGGWNRHLAVGGATKLGEALLRYWCPFWHHNGIGLFPELYVIAWRWCTGSAQCIDYFLGASSSSSSSLLFKTVANWIKQKIADISYLLPSSSSFFVNFISLSQNRRDWTKEWGATSPYASMTLVRIHSELVQARPKQ